MNLHIALAFICFIGAYGSAQAMNPKKNAYLKFKLDKDLRIIEHKSKNMDFFVPAASFEGEKITEVIPLTQQNLSAVNNGFQKACTGEKKKQKVRYTLEDKIFIATIRYKDKKNSFSVKVKEAVDKK